MKDKKTILIILCTTIIAIGMTVYSERTTADKIDKEQQVYKNEVYTDIINQNQAINRIKKP